MKKDLRQLLRTEDAHLEKLNELVVEAIKEESLISAKLNEFEDKHPAFTSKLADRVASFGGSWKFIIAFFVFMMLWMAVNLYLLTRPFDKYPFILLNLLLSTLAAIQAPIIMMSQNRKEEKDRQRAINDYMVNLKAEIEIRNMHQKLDLLMAEQMRTLFDIQKLQLEMMEEIKVMLKTKPA
jgi:uncharacterized membrane protein